MTFRVVIDVRKLYTIEIEAKSEDDARDIANAMQTTDIYEQGSLGEIETEVIEVSEV